ncbi:GNAT family N-acetyltransferase [Sphingobium sp. CAP-1]|uniref:GNAT family N-acetyltransferase n=1 Tax=Sphingobium sp. CAP-1 TaxID=2676077 RepID=UPI0012BB2037|nr:GNAT family N-acetyltransferase [Sphingobium sp. CAP-1]QGP78595.1 GNAT family N-acetyltransferase [Sphingobium sp. CAP-1]
MSILPAASSFQASNSHEWPAADVDRPIVRMVRHADLTADDRACWAALSAQAGAANIFAQDWFMDAALSHAHDGRDVLLAVVSLGRGPWLGVMPLMAEWRFGRWPAHIWHNWSATNQFLGTPLVAAQSAHIFWDYLLTFLDTRAGGEILLHFDGFDADDPVSMALFDHCRQEGRALHTIQCVDRPAHRAGDDGAGRGDPKTQGRLRSLLRRLERDHGPVAVTLLDPAQPCAPWIDAFLELEASGWKGRAGSALGSDPATEALFRTVIERGHANGSARLASLSTGGHVIAMSSWFESATWGHGFKMAYDEGYRAYAPGQLLMHDVSDRIGRRPDMSFDTCVPRGANHYHRLWHGNRRIIDGAVAIGSRWHRLHFDALIRARAAYAAVKNHFHPPQT